MSASAEDCYHGTGAIEIDVEVAKRAEELGIPVARYRACYLEECEPRELFEARVHRDRALKRFADS